MGGKVREKGNTLENETETVRKKNSFPLLVYSADFLSTKATKYLFDSQNSSISISSYPYPNIVHSVEHNIHILY